MKTKLSIALLISFTALTCEALEINTPEGHEQEGHAQEGHALEYNVPEHDLCLQSDSVAESYEAIVESGINAAKDQRLSEAEQLFNKAIHHSPDDHRNALVYMNLGKVQEAQDNNKGALQSYSSAISQYPNNVLFLSIRAKLYLKLENYRKAIADYTTIINVKPSDIKAYSYRGYAYSKTRELDHAKADFKVVTENDADNFMAALGSVIVEQQMGHNHEALTQLNIIISRFPDKAEPLVIRAEIESESNQKELAVIDLDSAIKLLPNRNYYLKRAYLHLELQQKYLARQDFEKAIELGVPRQLLSEDLKKCQ